MSSVRHLVDSASAGTIRDVLRDVRDALQSLEVDGCDASDLQAIIDKAAAELDSERPNIGILGNYLNTLARSLRAEPRVRTVVMELDAAMRAAQLPSTWEC
jgi:hypothetical protein